MPQAGKHSGSVSRLEVCASNAQMISEPVSPKYVSHADNERLLASLVQLPGEELSSFFGPDSISWQVNRESAVFLGAGRAALLQLAHPWVAVALAHHSNLLHDAMGRFHGTFRVVYTMLFGTRAQATAASRELYRQHASVRGQLPSAIGSHPAGKPYRANEVGALLWVYSTLVESALLAYEFVLPPLSPSQREMFYVHSKRTAALFGIPEEALPPDWQAFTRYTAAMFDSNELGVDANSLALARSILSGAGTWVKPPRWYLALTASWMPPRLRAAFELPFSAQEQRSLAHAALWLPRLYPHLPRILRWVGPYHEARARLRGRAPGLLTRQSNRFWMGRPRLLHAGLANDSTL